MPEEKADISKVPLPPELSTGWLGPAVGTTRRSFGLDAMRATAITVVVLSHVVPFLDPLGKAGVELFFVLSGYLIGGILIGISAEPGGLTGRALRTFWTRRWMRTLPAYYLCLIVLVLLGTPEPGETSFHRFWTHALFVQNFAWPCPWFFAVSWSLAIEEWFYVLFPLVLLAGFGLSNRRKPWLGAVVIFLLVPFLLRGWVGPGDNWDQNLRKVVVFRLDAIVFGVAMALIQNDARALWQRLAARARWWILAALALSLGFVPMVRACLAHSWLLAGLFSLWPLVLAASIPWWLRLREPAGATARWVARISSYSYLIYLCHVPILDACRAWATRLGAGTIGQIGAEIIALAIILAVAALGHHAFEKPIMDLRPRQRSS